MLMKYIYSIFAFVVLLAVACQTETRLDRDTTAPGQISNVTFTPANGGGCFKFTIPSDPDYLYTRAEYTIDNGQVLSKTASVYSDSLVINGMGTVKPYTVKLYSVDRAANESQPVIMEVTPLEPTVSALINFLNIFPGFSSVAVTMQNPQEEPVDIYIKIKGADGREALKVYASKDADERFYVKGLEAKPYEVSAHIVDHYGNVTKEKNFGTMTPKVDYELSKKAWTFLRDQRLYGSHWDYTEADWNKQKPYPEYQATYKKDSLMNARETNFEGDIKKFWNGQTDTDPKFSLDYFHSGMNYPFSYYIDLGREVQISRLRIWQRSSCQWARYSCKTFDIYVSNDKNPEDGILDDWTFVGRYSLVKPADPVEARREFQEGSEFWIYPDNPDFTRPFRYLRWKAVEDFNQGTIACMSELTLYGKDMK